MLRKGIDPQYGLPWSPSRVSYEMVSKAAAPASAMLAAISRTDCAGRAPGAGLRPHPDRLARPGRHVIYTHSHGCCAIVDRISDASVRRHAGCLRDGGASWRMTLTNSQRMLRAPLPGSPFVLMSQSEKHVDRIQDRPDRQLILRQLRKNIV